MSRRAKIALFVFFVLLAPILPAFTGVYLFVQAEKVSFCASCHTMTPWVQDLENQNSRSVASAHFRNGFIPHDQCYTCHVDYDFLGPIDAKIKAMRDVAVYYLGNVKPKDIRLSKPFPNENCLHCHVRSRLFTKSASHRAKMIQILADQIKCAVCHRPIHEVRFDDPYVAGLQLSGHGDRGGE